MLRRTHKKSRAGCLECKRRHVKCDEQRPKCIICTLSDRPCGYPPSPPLPLQDQQDDQTPPENLKYASSPWAKPPCSPEDPEDATMAETNSATFPHVSRPPHAIIPDEPPDSAAADVNLDHMELLIKFSVPDHFPEMDQELHDYATRLHADSMLRAPCYLYETLALSARRLSIVDPENAEKHCRYAVNLQTKAISLYNRYVSTVKIDNVNCVPIIQFASLLGRHLLIDVLAKREADLNVFIDHYVESVRIHSGIKLITHAAWPFLIDSGMQNFLLWAGSLQSAQAVGAECDPLRNLISSISGLDSAIMDAFQTAIRTLQVGFDLMRTESDRNCRYWSVFAWSVAAPEEFTNMLAQRRPEALVFLAYFGVLLHYSRDQWQVGTSGSYLINAVSQHLGSDWSEILSYPMSVLTTDPLV